MRLFQRAALFMLALAVLGLPVAAGGPALASTAGAPAAAVAPCLSDPAAHDREDAG